MTNTVNINNILSSETLQNFAAKHAGTPTNGTVDLANLSVALQHGLELIKGQLGENFDADAPANGQDLETLLSSLLKTDPDLPQGKKQAATAPAAPAAPAKTAPSAPAETASASSTSLSFPCTTNSVSYAAFGLAMALVGGAISKMTTEVSNNSSKTSLMNVDMSRGALSYDNVLETNALNNLSSQLNESGWDHFWHDVSQSLGVIISLALIIGGCATGNFEIAFAVGAMMILKDTGALSYLATGVADLCMKIDPNMSQQTAQVIGDIVSDVVGAAACLLCGRIGAGLEAGGEAVAEGVGKGAKTVVDDAATDGEEGTEMVDMASAPSEDLVEQSSRTVQNQVTEKFDIEKPEKKFMDNLKEFASKAKDALKKVNPFHYTPKFVNEAAFGLSQSWTATGTSNAILQTISFSNSTTQAWIEGIVEGFTALTSLLISGGAMWGMAEGSGAASRKPMNATLNKVLTGTKIVAGTGLAVSETVQGGLSIWEGILTEQYGKNQSSQQMLQYIMGLISQDSQINSSFISQFMTSNFNELNTLMSIPGTALAAIAESMYQA
ncbi:MAG: hypothetical protein AB7H48_02115 [Parachlamydiales bacterium]